MCYAYTHSLRSCVCRSVLDPFKLTRKRYREELRVPISREDLALLVPLKGPILQAFDDDSLIEFANSDPTVWDSMKTTIAPSLTNLSTKTFRLFVLQSMYGEAGNVISEPIFHTNPTPSSIKAVQVPLKNLPATAPITAPQKSIALPPLTIPTAVRTPHVQLPAPSLTIPTAVRAPHVQPDVQMHVSPNVLPVVKSRPDAHLPQQVMNSKGEQFLIQRCTCLQCVGASDVCLCEACMCEEPCHHPLVPTEVFESRQVGADWEFRVAFNNKTQGWIPRWPLSLWSLKCYTRFFESRALCVNVQ